MRNIIVFEIVAPDAEPVLDWRLERQALPNHSSPVAMVVDGKILQWGAQEFAWDDVRQMAEEQSGVPIAGVE